MNFSPAKLFAARCTIVCKSALGATAPCEEPQPASAAATPRLRAKRPRVVIYNALLRAVTFSIGRAPFSSGSPLEVQRGSSERRRPVPVSSATSLPSGAGAPPLGQWEALQKLAEE